MSGRNRIFSARNLCKVERAVLPVGTRPWRVRGRFVETSLVSFEFGIFFPVLWASAQKNARRRWPSEAGPGWEFETSLGAWTPFGSLDPIPFLV